LIAARVRENALLVRETVLAKVQIPSPGGHFRDAA